MVYSLPHLHLQPIVQKELCSLSNQVFHLHKDLVGNSQSQCIVNKALATFFSKGDKHCFNGIKYGETSKYNAACIFGQTIYFYERIRANGLEVACFY